MLLSLDQLWLFLLAGLLLNITPGPDMALVITRSTRYGTRAGIAAALGIGAGTFVHIAAAAIGISALIMPSAWAFTLLKWVGAAYLIYCGVRMMLARPATETDAATEASASTNHLRAIFVQGFLTNAFNPKVAIFFLAFLPQFIPSHAPSKVAAFITLGLIFDVTGTIWNVGVAWAAGRISGSSLFATGKIWLERVVGALFVAVGVRIALADRGP